MVPLRFDQPRRFWGLVQRGNGFRIKYDLGAFRCQNAIQDLEPFLGGA
jgi:hypothetical protein